MLASFFSAPPLLLGLALATPTTLQLRPSAPEEPYLARYSQAVLLEARLVDAEGQPLPGKRVSFFVSRDDDEEGAFLLEDPLTDGEGMARARLTLVDGRYGGREFPAAAATPELPGARYVLRATFTGDVAGDACPAADDTEAVDRPGGGAADGGITDGSPVDGGPEQGLEPSRFCEAEDVHDLFVAVENVRLSLQPGNEVALGETLALVARLEDANGNAPSAGTAVDGDGPIAVAGRTIGFYYDADGNGRPSAAERLGTAETDPSGVATFSFLADPAFVRAQTAAAGLHVQFGGDERYALAGAEQALVVFPGAPEASRTLLRATPETLLADGFSTVEIRATLVDAYNNPLDAEQEARPVRFTASLGTWVDELERDPLSGEYLQELQAPLSGGTAEVQVWVDDAPGTRIEVAYLDRGCGCQGTSDAAALGWLALGLVAMPAARRRRQT